MIGRIPVAFAAGLVSFLAPCVLPLVPGYLSAVSAVDAGRLGERGAARRVVVSSIPFVLGFTAVFVALGTGAAAAGGLLPLGGIVLAAVAIGVGAWRWSRSGEPDEAPFEPALNGHRRLDPELERRLDEELARFDA